MVHELFHEAILAGDREGMGALTKRALDDGIPVATIINGYLMPAMDEVGRLYGNGEFFIPEMLMSARAMQARPDPHRQRSARGGPPPALSGRGPARAVRQMRVRATLLPGAEP